MEIRAVAFHSIRRPSNTITTTQFILPLRQVPLPPVISKLSFSPTNSKTHFFTLNAPSSLSPRVPDAPQSSRQSHLPVARSTADDGASVGLATPPAKAEPSLQLMKKSLEVSYDLKGTSIFLLGMSSTMKTSVGELIAETLGYYYFDSDGIVEDVAGSDPSGKSYRERDEKGFRAAETEALRELSSMGRLVVNAGNGAVQSVTNLAFIRHGISIWIDVPLDMIAQEVPGNGKDIASSLESSSEVLNHLIAVYEENRGGYGTADARVSLLKIVSEKGYDSYDQVSAEDMAMEVFTEIEKLTRVKKMMEEAAKPF